MTLVQNLALCLVEPYTIGLGPWNQPIQIPVQNLPILQKINTSTVHDIVCKLIEGVLDPLVQVIDEDTEP